MNAFKRRKFKLITLFALLAAMLFSSVAMGADTLPRATDNRSQTVRVLLSRLGLTDRVDLTLASPYGLKLENGGVLRFEGGSELHILLRDDQLYVHYQGMSVSAGRSLTLSRSAVEDGTEYGFRRTNFPALYAGDLALSVNEGAMRPVLSINVENYLLGVVPYEMSDYFPLEALKAQAVAARTYALRKQSPSDPYDVVDTTNDQVFKGYEAGNARAEQAIAETRGVCGFYEGKLAQCFYSASNGGQTERTSAVWSGEDLPYYAFGSDKYDVENPASTVKSLVIAKKYGADETAPYGLRKLLATQLAGELTARGYDPAPESVRVDEVLSVSVDTPVGESGSKLMSMFHIELKLSGRTRKDAPIVVSDENDEEVSLAGSEPTLAPETPTPEATPSPTPAPTPAPSYGPFTPLESSVKLDAPIFKDVESAFAMGISSNLENEIWSVREGTSNFTVEARRYGHGVGMSQRGAQWMAEMYKQSYVDILAFYYPGMSLAQFDEEPFVAASDDPALAETAGPAPSPTPRPTLMPVTQEAQEGQWYALVTGIDDDSSLNLRDAPDMGGEVVRRLYKHQRLLVLERCPEEGWVKVQTDAVEGYVVESFLTKED